MTEYDYSPEAWERYLATQHRIARWVDGTLVQPPCNAFTPATPHVQALALQQEKQQRRKAKSTARAYYEERDDVDSDSASDDYSYSRSSQHRKARSTGHHSQHQRRPSRQERSRERVPDKEVRDREYGRPSPRQPPQRREKKDRDSDKDDFVFVERRAPTPAAVPPSRLRSSSHSTQSRPPHSSRSHATPHLSLDLPPFPSSAPPGGYYNRYSGHSSHSSNTTPTRPSSGSTTHGLFPTNQAPPHSAPITGQSHMKPVRSQTMPTPYMYGAYQQVTDKNGYPVNRVVGPQPVVVPLRSGAPVGSGKPYGVGYAPDPSKAPQLPWSSYQSPTKQRSLLKRMFTGLTGKQHQPPSPTNREKEGSMFLGGGRKMTRKRSVSF